MMGFILIEADAQALICGVIIPMENYMVPRFSFGGADFILN